MAFPLWLAQWQLTGFRKPSAVWAVNLPALIFNLPDWTLVTSSQLRILLRCELNVFASTAPRADALIEALESSVFWVASEQE